MFKTKIILIIILTSHLLFLNRCNSVHCPTGRTMLTRCVCAMPVVCRSQRAGVVWVNGVCQMALKWIEWLHDQFLYVTAFHAEAWKSNGDEVSTLNSNEYNKHFYCIFFFSIFLNDALFSFKKNLILVFNCYSALKKKGGDNILLFGNRIRQWF